MDIMTYIPLVMAVILTASGQLLVKKASQLLNTNFNSFQEGNKFYQLIKKILTIVFEPHIFIALILYFLVLFLWLKVLSKAELSYAYPIFISLTVLITTVSSVFLFKETLGVYKVLGMICLMAGLFLISIKSY